MTCFLDLHVHTDASDDGRSTLAQMAAAARAAGIHAMAVTDHNLCTPVPAELEGVLLIPGCEVSTQSGHITGLFLERPLDLKNLRRDGLPTAQAACEEIHRCGGLAVLAHPFEKRNAQPCTGAAYDAVEGCNARAEFKVRGANRMALELAGQLGLPAVGGSDGHSSREVGNARTRVEAESCSLAALRQAILQGNCAPELVRLTPHIRKGLSQWKKARRKGGVPALARGIAYLAYCVLLDLRP